MTHSNQATILDCRGQQCPAPILALSKKARGMAADGGLVEILADDAAFPLDLRAWCRSAGAELVQLSEDDDGYNRGLVRVPAKGGGTAKAPPPVPKPAPRPALHVAAESVEELDCRGARCPEPILRLSRLARESGPGTTVDVLADDDAFPLDLKSWCRSSGAELVSLESEGSTHRGRVKFAGKAKAAPPAPAPRPVPRVADAPSPAPMPTPVAAAAAAAPMPTPAASAFAFTADLRALNQDRWVSVLDAAAAALDPGQQLLILAPAEATSVVQWCATNGHAIKQLQSGADTRLEVEVGVSSGIALASEETALEKASNAADCTLLVLHNDHEALLAALLVAVGAASQGRDVVVFFTFWGLNMLRGDTPNPDAPVEKSGWMQSMMKMMMPAGPKRQSLGQMHFGGMGKWMLGSIMKDKNIMSLPELMDAAESQGVRFIACTMSMEVMGISKRDLKPRPNLEFGGVAAFVEAAHGAGMSLVF